jgi:hypothetical protein
MMNNANHCDRSITKPRTLKNIEAQDIGIENPTATPWIESINDLSGIKLAKKAPISLPSATMEVNAPIKKKAIPTWIYSWGVYIFRFGIILFSLMKLRHTNQHCLWFLPD